MDGTQITTAHLALFIAAMGVVSSVGAGLMLFFLNRLVGGGDELRNKVHALELAQVAQYVTRTDMDTFRREVVGQLQALRADVNKMLSHYSPNASFQE